MLLWSCLPLQSEGAWAFASVEPLLKTLSIPCSLSLIQRCLLTTSCVFFTGCHSTHPRGKAAVVVTAGRSISHFLQMKTWIAVFTLRSYIWVAAARVLGVVTPAQRGACLLWSPHHCSSSSVSSTSRSLARQLLRHGLVPLCLLAAPCLLAHFSWQLKRKLDVVLLHPLARLSMQPGTSHGCV